MASRKARTNALVPLRGREECHSRVSRASFMAAPTSCRVSALVLLGILDHHVRRKPGQERGIGALLGLVEGAVVNVTNSYPVPHTETGETVAADMSFCKTMLDMHQRINPKEVIVGWYSSVEEITQHSQVLHEAFSHFVRHPVHLTIDSSLKKESMGLKAFVVPGFADGSAAEKNDSFALGTPFEKIPVALRNFEPGRVGMEVLSSPALKLDELLANNPRQLQGDLDNLSQSLEKIVDMLGAVTEYTGAVLREERDPDPEIGRALAEALVAVPNVRSDTFARGFNNSIEDLLMVVYLANLVRAQLGVGAALRS